jgi:energy-coupling factor transporter transmembrane protein EcfT
MSPDTKNNLSGDFSSLAHALGGWFFVCVVVTFFINFLLLPSVPDWKIYLVIAFWPITLIVVVVREIGLAWTLVGILSFLLYVALKRDK